MGWSLVAHSWPWVTQGREVPAGCELDEELVGSVASGLVGLHMKDIFPFLV